MNNEVVRIAIMSRTIEALLAEKNVGLIKEELPKVHAKILAFRNDVKAFRQANNVYVSTNKETDDIAHNNNVL